MPTPGYRGSPGLAGSLASEGRRRRGTRARFFRRWQVRCSDCRFFEAVRGSSSAGVCRVEPPRNVFAVPSRGVPSDVGQAWPLVIADGDWCGRFEARPEVSCGACRFWSPPEGMRPGGACTHDHPLRGYRTHDAPRCDHFAPREEAKP